MDSWNDAENVKRSVGDFFFFFYKIAKFAIEIVFKSKVNNPQSTNSKGTTIFELITHFHMVFILGFSYYLSFSYYSEIFCFKIVQGRVQKKMFVDILCYLNFY